MEKKTISNEDEKIRALIQAGYGKEARPTTDQREVMLNKMKSEIQAVKTRTEFPPAVLIAIPLIMMFLGVWLFAANADGTTIMRDIIITGLTLNLLCIPISSLLIIYRRRYDAKK